MIIEKYTGNYYITADIMCIVNTKPVAVNDIIFEYCINTVREELVCSTKDHRSHVAIGHLDLPDLQILVYSIIPEEYHSLFEQHSFYISDKQKEKFYNFDETVQKMDQLILLAGEQHIPLKTTYLIDVKFKNDDTVPHNLYLKN